MYKRFINFLSEKLVLYYNIWCINITVVSLFVSLIRLVFYIRFSVRVESIVLLLLLCLGVILFHYANLSMQFYSVVRRLLYISTHVVLFDLKINYFYFI